MKKLYPREIIEILHAEREIQKISTNNYLHCLHELVLSKIHFLHVSKKGKKAI